MASLVEAAAALKRFEEEITPLWGPVTLERNQVGNVSAIAADGTYCGWISLSTADYDVFQRTEYRTRSGKVLSDADIQALADEAEREGEE